MEGLVMAGQLILALSILVSLHEFGHYITAKWFKMRVDKFYLFFDFLFPVPTLLNFSLFKKKVGDTEYGIGWFPLGGYVSIAGMIDETQDASKLAATPEPWEFRGKPAWQRLIVMLGGIIVNIILGILIFVVLTFKNGNNYVSKAEINKTGVAAGELARKLGFKNGDKIVAVNGKDIKAFSEIYSPDVLFGENASISVEREGKLIDVNIPKDFANKIIDKKKNGGFLDPMLTFHVGGLTPAEKPSFIKKVVAFFKGQPSPTEVIYPATIAGIQEGDSITYVNNIPVKYFHEFSQSLEANKNKTISLKFVRKGKDDSLKINVNKEGKLGIMPALHSNLKETHEDYTFGQSIGVGTNKAFAVITDNLKAFSKIFKNEIDASKAISGPIGISQIFGGIWDWNRFWMLTGLLSMSLAFMNALPIPALDGGHALFLLWEIVTGKTPSVRVQEIAQQIGTFMLLGLMVFAFGNDIFKLF
jgi:regulator of sigma E protease